MRAASQLLRSATPSPVSAEIMKVASNLAFSLAILVSSSSVSRGTRSILLRIRIFARFTSASRASSASASSSMPLRASISTPTRSASCAPLQAVVTMARSSRRFGAKMPGVSTKMSCDLPSMRDAADQRARGLHLVRDDGDLGADQRVEQRRLAGIGRADQRDEAAARVACWLYGVSHQACPPTTPTRVSMAAAAACSAARLDEPMPSAGGRSGSTTATRNSGS